MMVHSFRGAPRRTGRCTRQAVALLLTAIAWSTAASAQEVAPPPATSPGTIERTVRAVQLLQPLTLDGRIDEAVYREVPPITGFVQQEPHEGEPETEKTDAWIFFDNKNLYVAARMWDSHPDRILATEMRRDNAGIPQLEESFTVVLDTFHDQRSGVLFMTTPLGAMMEGSFTTEKDYNSNYDQVWNPRATRFDGGWSVEMEIPFKSLRYPGPGEQVWGVNLRRIVRWKNEFVHLTRVPPALGYFGVARMAAEATLVGLRTPAGSKNIEAKPYVLSRVVTDRLAVPPKSDQLGGDIGVDLKFGLTRGLTADFTYNTDFAQAEADQQQVNLTRFSLFFPEKREFFLEGQGAFNFGGNADTTELPVLFFSRRIGIENGLAVPIRVGGRVSGKAGRYTIGALNIMTADSDVARSPATTFRAVRVRRDLFQRGSIGVLATQRASDGGRENVVVGGDVNVELGLSTINAYYARTHTTGVQGRTASYYAQLDYNADRYGVTVEHLTVEPQFSPDIGFLRRTNFRKEYGYFRFSPRPKHLWGVRKLYYEGSLKYITDISNHLQSRAAIGAAKADIDNGDQIAVTFQHDYEFLAAPFVLQPTVIIPTGGYTFQSGSASYTFGPRHTLRGTISASTGSFYDGTRRSVSYTGRPLEIAKQLALEPSISENWIDVPWGRFRTDLISALTTYSFSPRANLAALVQFNSAARSLSSNIRFRWQYVPGSDLFVIYNDARTTLVPDRLTDLQSRTLLVKITRLFRY